MNLPKLPVSARKQDRQTIQFRGLDWRQEAGEGTLAHSGGLSARRYPALSQSQGRGVYGTYSSPTAIFAREKLCVVDGTSFLYDGERVGTVTAGEKEMAVVNTKLCIFPDKLYLDLDSKKFGSLEASASSVPKTAVFTDKDLTFVPNPHIANKNVWMGHKYDHSKSENVEVRYYDDPVTWKDGAWVKGTAQVALEREIADEGASDKIVGKYIIPGINAYGDYLLPARRVGESYPAENTKGIYGVITTARYVNQEEWDQDAYSITAQLYDGTTDSAGILAQFKVGDGVEISGCTQYKENNKSAIIRSLTDTVLTFDGGVFTAGSEAGAVTVQRAVPDMDFICERDNRLWGCGGTTIYASALGDPGNFNVFDGLATDSYAVAVGTEGPFTGCVGYSSGALFFKENCVHKLLGTSPKNYQMNTMNYWGVQRGSHRSLCVVNEVLYYKGVTGVFAYTGGSPVCISECFGTRTFSKAAGGSDGKLYYLSMEDEDGQWHLFTLDLERGIWLREDATQAVQMATVDGQVHLLAGDTVFLCGQGEGAGAWSAQLNPLHEGALGKKRYTRLALGLELGERAWVGVETRVDGGPWRAAWRSPPGRRVVTLPLRPTRCDTLELRLTGEGPCTVRTLERRFDIGSEA